MAASVQITCPPNGTNVPAAFYVSGTYATAYGPTESVECHLTYNGGAVNLCKVCALDSANGTWCCYFDFSALATPTTTIQLVASLFSSGGTLLAGPSRITVNYVAGAPAPNCLNFGQGTTPCMH